MADPGPAPDQGGGPRRPRRPAALFFEPPAPQPDEEHFFALETITDPGELLARATELALAFQAAADRAVEFQAMAAAQLADPSRFDALPAAAVGDLAGWTEDYAAKMVDYGRKLLRGRPSPEE
ncbi:hypothetical protein RM780_12595 [Streptomyces sp. DSM 44917]|uniref:Phasin protein n=1 Tax=Streptomyces boetiae TaxID=3075541 RepID=A0ABU2L8J9_9ACTN|nr:hypothetical protein [Streptomyces sp. DSM 44917]MDT0307796.1 hypothetical protein [Streptomyces sp. DSM 44917]